jgi:hypothetical protein
MGAQDHPFHYIIDAADSLQNQPIVHNLLSAALLVVFGFASMTLEILASNLMAPYFGTSVYTWGSIIGVFLVAMTLGYAIGGLFSRWTRRLHVLGLLLAAGSLLVLAIPFVYGAVCGAIVELDLGPRFGPLLATAVLMSPSVLTFSGVSPFLINVLTQSRSEAGFRSGMVLAVSTSGSILGTIVTSFYLIDLFRVSRILMGVGSVCFGTALVVILVGLRQRPRQAEASSS